MPDLISVKDRMPEFGDEIVIYWDSQYKCHRCDCASGSAHSGRRQFGRCPWCCAWSGGGLANTARRFLTAWRRCCMELDPRRLGLRAQVQIVLALLEKDKERRNLCGGSGFDRAVRRSQAAENDIRTADCQDQRDRTKRDYRQVSRSRKEKRKIKELKRGRAGEPAPLDMILSGTPGMTGAAQRTIYI